MHIDLSHPIGLAQQRNKRSGISALGYLSRYTGPVIVVFFFAVKPLFQWQAHLLPIPSQVEAPCDYLFGCLALPLVNMVRNSCRPVGYFAG